MMLNLINLRTPMNPRHPLNRGRVAWWLAMPGRLGGRYLYDLCGRNHGTLTNGPLWKPTTRQGGWGHVQFDGVNDWVRVTDNPALSFGTAPMSIMFWGRTSTVAAPNKCLAYGKLLNGGSFDGWHGGLDSNGYATFIWRTGSTNYAATGSTNLADGRWHHYAHVRLSTGIYTYVDGLLVASNTNASTQANVDNSQDLAIGDGRSGSPTGEQWTGQLDSLTIYNRGLSASEVFADCTLSRMGYPEVLNRYEPMRIGGSAALANYHRLLRAA